MKTTKRFVSLAICLIMIMSFSVTVFAEELPAAPVDVVEDEQPVYITGYVKDDDGANLRQGPSLSSSILHWLPQYTTFNVHGITVLESGETWYYVYVTSGNFTFKYGYLRKDVVTIN